MRFGVAARRQPLQRDRAGLLLPRAAVPARLRPGRRGAPDPPAGPVRDREALRRAADGRAPPRRSDLTGDLDPAVLGAVGGQLRATTSARGCASRRRPRASGPTSTSTTSPTRSGSPPRRRRPATRSSTSPRPTSPRTRRSRRWSQRFHGDAAPRSAPLGRGATRAGSRSPRRAALLGYDPQRSWRDYLDDDGRLRPAVPRAARARRDRRPARPAAAMTGAHRPAGWRLTKPRAAARLQPPARAVLAAARRVEAQPGDRHVGVAAVGVDGDPLARAAPRRSDMKPGRVARGASSSPACVEHVGDGARAVVARCPRQRAVAAAPLVGLARDAVGGGDRAWTTWRRRARRARSRCGGRRAASRGGPAPARAPPARRRSRRRRRWSASRERQAGAARRRQAAARARPRSGQGGLHG